MNDTLNEHKPAWHGSGRHLIVPKAHTNVAKSIGKCNTTSSITAKTLTPSQSTISAGSASTLLLSSKLKSVVNSANTTKKHAKIVHVKSQNSISNHTTNNTTTNDNSGRSSSSGTCNKNDNSMYRSTSD
uniref:Uncharacterized protein n=1 Tax=Lygus hesperus TaxID=30085 RepID=A0A0A9WGD1_LYGHE